MEFMMAFEGEGDLGVAEWRALVIGWLMNIG